MKRIINDNIPKILKLDNNKLSTCKDKKEFFKLLRVKILDNANKIFDAKDKSKKINALFDLLYDLSVVRTEFGDAASDDKMLARNEYTASYINKYVYDDGIDGIKTVDDVMKYGKDNNYPAMILKRIDGKVTKTLGDGELAWKNLVASATMAEPYNENFIDLVNAINNNDIYEHGK